MVLSRVIRSAVGSLLILSKIL